MVGQTISHYRIIEKLGGGGMGVVYKAEDLKLGRFVALKFLPDDVAKDPQALARFQREAKAASALNHPNICTIYEIDDQHGQAFIAMEYLEGMTLKHKIAGKPLEIETRAGFGHPDRRRAGRGALQGNHSSRHQAGQHFCDRPRAGKNSRLRSGQSHCQAEGSGMSCPDSAISRSISPAQAARWARLPTCRPSRRADEELDARTDLFSFGLVLYEMATARPAFSGGTSAMVFDAILHKAPVSPLRLNPDFAGTRSHH